MTVTANVLFGSPRDEIATTLSEKLGSADSIAALLMARAFHASVAVMLVKSFSPESRWSDDFRAFCSAHACNQLAPGVFEILGISGPRLIVGWCKGDQTFLSVELPSAF